MMLHGLLETKRKSKRMMVWLPKEKHVLRGKGERAHPKPQEVKFEGRGERTHCIW